MLDNIKENMMENIDSARDSFIEGQTEKRPGFVMFIRMLLSFKDDMINDNVGLYAAQAAFFTMLSAVPFLMLIILCLKYFINVDLKVLTSTVRNTFPAPVSTYISSVLSEIFVRSESTALLSATIITALWTSSKGIMSVYLGLNNIYGYQKIPNWLTARIVSVFYAVIFVVVIVGSITCLVFGNAVLHFFGDKLENYFLAHYAFSVVFKMKYLIFFVLFVLAFTGLYSFLPQKKVRFIEQIPGAAATAVGWVGFSYIFSLYIMYFSKYSVLYGSLTAIIFLMLWTFFCIYMLLIGAEINTHIKSGYFGQMSKILRNKNKKSNKP